MFYEHPEWTTLPWVTVNTRVIRGRSIKYNIITRSRNHTWELWMNKWISKLECTPKIVEGTSFCFYYSRSTVKLWHRSTVKRLRKVNADMAHCMCDTGQCLEMKIACHACGHLCSGTNGVWSAWGMLLEMQNLLAARRIGEILAAMSRSDDDLGFGDICDVNGDSKMKIRSWQRLHVWFWQQRSRWRDWEQQGDIGKIS